LDSGKLEDLLISNEIGDFKIAFSFWGAIFGYADMPKTFTNDLFGSNDLTYTGEVYKHIYEQLHGIKLEGNLNTFEREPDTEIAANADARITVTPKSENDVQKTSADDETEIRQKLFNAKIKKDFINSIVEAWGNNGRKIDAFLFVKLNDYPIIGKKEIPKIKKALDFVETSPTQDFLLETPEPEPGTEFYKDGSVWLKLVEIVPVNQRRKVKEEIDFIQDGYKNNGYEKLNGTWVDWTNKSRSNKAVISHFEKNAKKKTKAKYEIDHEIIDKVVAKLKEIYNVK